jgi:hypothetical protein
MRWARTVAAETFGGSGPGPVQTLPPAQPSLARADRAA